MKMLNLIFIFWIIYSECYIYEITATFEEQQYEPCCIKQSFEFQPDSCTQI